MRDKIQPALTPEEWRVRRRERPDERMEAYLSHDGLEVVLPCDGDATGATTPGERHGLAALCLDDQPFGFSWEDVNGLRGMAWDLLDIGSANHNPKRADALHDLADRIAALLPPREPTA